MLKNQQSLTKPTLLDKFQLKQNHTQAGFTSENGFRRIKILTCLVLSKLP